MMFPDCCHDHECPPPGQSPPVCDLSYCQAQVLVQNPYQQGPQVKPRPKLRGLRIELTLELNA